MIRTGQSLLEVMVATGLLVGVAATTLGAFASTSEEVSAGAVRQTNVERCRRVADALARELRDANATPGDLDPPAPHEATALGYRAVVGLDPTTVTALLSPPRESGDFRRVSLEGDEVVLVTPAGTRALAAGVSDLRLTLLAPGLLELQVESQGRDGRGELLRDRVQVLVALENALP